MIKNITSRTTTKKKREWKKEVNTIHSRLVLSREDLIQLLNDHVLMTRNGEEARGSGYVAPVARVSKKGDDLVLSWEDTWT